VCVCVCVCVCVHFYFCFLPLPFLFFFIFSVTASESSRPIGVEIVEIDQPTDRLADRSTATPRPTSASARNPVKYTTVAFSVACECNANWNMILSTAIHRGQEEKKRVTLTFIERNALLYEYHIVPFAISQVITFPLRFFIMDVQEFSRIFKRDAVRDEIYDTFDYLQD